MLTSKLHILIIFFRPVFLIYFVAIVANTQAKDLSISKVIDWEVGTHAFLTKEVTSLAI